MTTETEIKNWYTLLNAGKVQHFKPDGKRWGIAFVVGDDDGKLARELAKLYNCRAGLIGTVPGETLENHIELALKAGLAGAWIADGGGGHWFEFD